MVQTGSANSMNLSLRATSWLRSGVGAALAVVLLCSFSSTAQATPIGAFETLTQAKIEQSYFFDWNRNAKFRVALNNAFARTGVRMPAWLRQGSGPSAPARVLHQGNTHWVLLNTCKSHDCGKNVVYVAFDPPTRTTAAVGKFGGQVLWIGKPNDALRLILSNYSGLR